MIWYDMIWYDMMWYDLMWCDMIWYDTIWYDVIWCDMIWYDMIWFDIISCIYYAWVVCNTTDCSDYSINAKDWASPICKCNTATPCPGASKLRRVGSWCVPYSCLIPDMVWTSKHILLKSIANNSIYHI